MSLWGDSGGGESRDGETPLPIIDFMLCFRAVPFSCSFPPINLSDPSLPCYFHGARITESQTWTSRSPTKNSRIFCVQTHLG